MACGTSAARLNTSRATYAKCLKVRQSKDLLLASFDVVRVQVRALQGTKVVLYWCTSKGVGAAYNYLDALVCQVVSRLLTAVIRSAVKQHNSLLLPVLVLLTELGHQLLQVQAKLLAAGVDSAQRKEHFATSIDSCNETQSWCNSVSRLRVAATLFVPPPLAKV